MKKNLYMILIIFLLIVAIIYFIANENLTTTEYINEEIAVDLSKCNIIIVKIPIEDSWEMENA